MSRQARLSLMVLGGALLIAAAFFLFRPEPEQDPQEEQASLVQVVALEPGSGPIEVFASGTVEPRESVVIAAEVGGRVAYVHPRFTVGGQIGQGETLIRIDDRDYRNRVRTAQADVAAQDVAVLQAEEEVELARQEIERFSNRNGASESFVGTIDETDYASRILPPNRLAGREAASSTQTPASDSAPRQSPSINRLATREPQLRSARAARERAGASLSDARLALQRTRVVAPFSGIVESETVAIGAIVQPGQSLGTLIASGAYEVRMSVSEKDAALVPGLLTGRAGSPASVYLNFDGRTYRWDAVVARVNRLRDTQTRQIEVLVRVPSPDRGGALVANREDETAPSSESGPPLLLGSFVEVGLTGGTVEQYASIPPSALRPGNEIWVVRDGKLEILKVRVLQRTDTRALVANPTIAEGGQLVTSALRAPVEGMAVRIARADGSAREKNSSAASSSPTPTTAGRAE